MKQSNEQLIKFLLIKYTLFNIFLIITCGKLSGLDSNMTNNTPIGTVTCCNIKSSVNLVHFNTLPSIFVFSAICFMPSASVLNFFSFIDNLDNKTGLNSNNNYIQ